MNDPAKQPDFLMATVPFTTRPDVDACRRDSVLPRDLSLIVGTPNPSRALSALPRLSAELDLARQNRRGLALVVFCRDQEFAATQHLEQDVYERARSEPGDDRSHDGRRQFCSLVGFLLRQSTREIDAVTCAPSHDFCLVAMPEVTETEAQRAIRRLQRICAARLPSPLRAGLALFPRDGHTLEALVSRAETVARGGEPPRVVPKPDRRQGPPPGSS